MRENLNNDAVNRRKIDVAKSSMYAALFLTFIKIIAAYFSGSLAILSEVFHSAIDIIACTVTIISIKLSAKPPDEEHHYGHEKVESFAALFQVLILLLMCSYIFYEAAGRLFLGKEADVNISLWTFGVIIIAIIVDITRSRALKKVARETKSQALEADALHFSSDVLTSVVVLISMVITYLDINRQADSIAAVIVSVVIIIVGLKLSRKAIDALMDKVPAGLSEKIQYEAKLIEGVEGIKSFRIRSTGSKIFVDMTIFISRIIPFSRAHEIANAVERRILELTPEADVIIQSEPIETEKESINEKIRMIVSGFGLKSHDIFSHKINNEIFTELHIEIDNTNDLTKAHDIVTEIEESIKEKIKVISNVKIHIDEPSDILFDTTDITERSNEIIRIVKNITEQQKEINSYHDIKVVSSNGKIRVSLTCNFDINLSFDEVHDLVTLLESKIYLALKEYYPKISNVMIHAEPESISNL